MCCTWQTSCISLLLWHTSYHMYKIEIVKIKNHRAVLKLKRGNPVYCCSWEFFFLFCECKMLSKWYVGNYITWEDYKRIMTKSEVYVLRFRRSTYPDFAKHGHWSYPYRAECGLKVIEKDESLFIEVYHALDWCLSHNFYCIMFTEMYNICLQHISTSASLF